MQNIIPLLSKVLWSRINYCYRILFSYLKEKKGHIIISWVINSQMGPMYIETTYINRLLLFWDSFEWFCLQISSDAKYCCLSCTWHCDRGLIFAIEYYLQIWNKKIYKIFISWVISSHMDPIIEKRYKKFVL